MVYKLEKVCPLFYSKGNQWNLNASVDYLSIGLEKDSKFLSPFSSLVLKDKRWTNRKNNASK